VSRVDAAAICRRFPRNSTKRDVLSCFMRFSKAHHIASLDCRPLPRWTRADDLPTGPADCWSRTAASLVLLPAMKLAPRVTAFRLPGLTVIDGLVSCSADGGLDGPRREEWHLPFVGGRATSNVRSRRTTWNYWPPSVSAAFVADLGRVTGRTPDVLDQLRQAGEGSQARKHIAARAVRRGSRPKLRAKGKIHG
jgi:hypothetical protein